jgi:hypothetical protein
MTTPRGSVRRDQRHRPRSEAAVPEVSERKSGKNRLHIDVHSEPGGLDELVTRLEKLGATRIREVDEGPAGHWWVMQDPEGRSSCDTSRMRSRRDGWLLASSEDPSWQWDLSAGLDAVTPSLVAPGDGLDELAVPKVQRRKVVG